MPETASAGVRMLENWLGPGFWFPRRPGGGSGGDRFEAIGWGRRSQASRLPQPGLTIEPKARYD